MTRLDDLVIRLGAVLAPRARRTQFRQQWQAELAHRRMALAQLRRTPSPLRLLGWSAGALRHALWLRRQEFRPDMLAQDLAYALRGLRRNRSVTMIAVTTLALGIGATTAIFAVVDGALLRPLPYRSPDDLVMVYQLHRQWLESSNPFFASMGRRFPLSYPIFEEWTRQGEILDGIAAVRSYNMTLDLGDLPERVHGTGSAGDLSSVLGVAPHLGRWFSPQEDAIGGEPVVVVSWEFWRNRLGADPAALERTLQLDGVGHRVVGVMPQGFEFPADGGDFWLPLGAEDRRPEWKTGYLQAVARLRTGLTLDAATEHLGGIAGALHANDPAVEGMGVRLIPLREEEIGNERTSLQLLSGTVAMLLLVAAANVSCLLLVRGAERRHEMAVRVALGAGSGRLLRQFFAESVLLGLAGGVAGIALAYVATDALVALLPSGMRLRPIEIDARVLSFAIGVSLLTGLGVGLLGCLEAIRARPAAALAGASRTTSSRAHRRTLGVVVAAQVAIALVLLVGAALMLASLQRLMSVDRGFVADGIVALSVQLPDEGQPPAQIAAFAERVRERLAALPGVETVSAALDIPFSGSTSSTTIEIEGVPEDENDPIGRSSQIKSVSPGYFVQLGIPLRSGRAFNDEDTASAEPVAILSAAAATALFPGTEPVGARIRRRAEDQWMRVIGIVGDIRHGSLSEEPEAIVYAPFAQAPARNIFFTVSGLGDDDIDAARRAVAAIDGTPVERVATLESMVRASAARPRARAILVAIAAAIAVVLATVGVYGAIAYAVRQRTRELGIRIAIGARRGDVARHVLRWGMTLALAGVGVGLVVALAVGRTLEAFLYGITATDPWTISGAALLLLAVAAVACLRPALRAAATDPTTALRAQ